MDNNFEDFEEIFMMQCILEHVGTARKAMWAEQLRQVSCRFLNSTNRNLLLQLTTITINIDLTSTWEAVGFPFKIIKELQKIYQNTLIK